jgi:hypothetical protein
MKIFWLSSAVVLILTVAVFAYAEKEDGPVWMRSLHEHLEAVTNCPQQYRIDLQRDCGAKALAAALIILGNVPNYSEVEHELSVREKGTSLSRIEECANRNGLYTLAVSMPPRRLRRLKHLAILHVKSHPEAESPDHFVLYIGNDYRGRLRILESTDKIAFAAQERLERVWAGTALILSPNPLSPNNIFQQSYQPSVVSFCLFGGSMICLSVLALLTLRRLRRKRSGCYPYETREMSTIITLILLVIFISSSLVAYSGCDRKKSDSSGIGGVLIEPAILDLGVVRAGTKACGEIVVKNLKSSPLTIKNIDHSCSCIVTEFPKIIDAWGKGKLEVELSTGENSGVQTNTLAILTDRPEVPMLTVKIRALVQSEWKCAPRGINFGNIDWDRDRPQRSLTIDYLPMGPENAFPSIEAKENTNQFLDLIVESAPTIDTTKIGLRYFVSVTPKKAIPIGRFETSITVRGKVPDNITQVWEIPVWGDIKGPISVKPKSLVVYRDSVFSGDVVAEIEIKAVPLFLLKIENIECDDTDMLEFDVKLERDKIDETESTSTSKIQVLAKRSFDRIAGNIRIVCHPGLSIRVPYVIFVHRGSHN